MTFAVCIQPAMFATVIGIYLLTLTILAVYGFHRGHLVYLYWKLPQARAEAGRAHFDELPLVTIQLPMFNEMYVAERLIDSVAERRLPEGQARDPGPRRLDRRDRARSRSAKVEELTERGFNAVYLHRTEPRRLQGRRPRGGPAHGRQG